MIEHCAGDLVWLRIEDVLPALQEVGVEWLDARARRAPKDGMLGVCFYCFGDLESVIASATMKRCLVNNPAPGWYWHILVETPWPPRSPT